MDMDSSSDDDDGQYELDDVDDTETDKRIEQICFVPYTKEELRELSVIEVNRPESFDQLGNPALNGLYDLRLGPCGRRDRCATCLEGTEECEGHMGLIKLPVPVINPLLLRLLRSLFKVVCLKCNSFVMDRFDMFKLQKKLELLVYGIDYIVSEFEEAASMLLNRTHNRKSDSEFDDFKMKVNGLFNEIISSHKLGRPKDMDRTERANMHMKHDLIKEFLTFKTPRRICLSCKRATKKATLMNNTVFTANISKKDKILLSRSQDDDEEDEEEEEKQEVVIGSKKDYVTLNTEQVKKIMRTVWKNEHEILRLLCPFLSDLESAGYCHPTDVFFWDFINVPATRFTPLSHREGKSFEHEIKKNLQEVILAAKTLEQSLESSKDTGLSSAARDKLLSSCDLNWRKLQIAVNRVFDCDLDRSREAKNNGVKQILEKKEGLMRMHMMGKRVNYSARSVISPDPYICVNELGVPTVFAARLSYPEIVNEMNLKRLQKAIMMGPYSYPGAVSITTPNGQTRFLDPVSEIKRFEAANMIADSLRRGISLVVNRHVISGDILLFNRQPTLHKSSIMAHRARVLPRERTLRMHYSNCKSYNADFDGDEMNAHLPQSLAAKTEADLIAGVNQQYLVSKDGSPLSGLIQDHIISATLLSMRGTFFNEDEYHDLVYGCMSFLNRIIVTMPPAIMKPVKLWTGKQVISSIIMNCVSAKIFPSVSYPCKVKPKSFINLPVKQHNLKDSEMCESQVFILNGYLVSGLIDKSSIGNQQLGLVHVCYELYGGQVSSDILTSFSRLGTNYLQGYIAFTLGIEDILVIDSANEKRRSLMKHSQTVGPQAVSDALARSEKNVTEERLKEKIQEAHTSRTKLGIKFLDQGYKGKTSKINNDISGTCLAGLVKKFPQNNLQLMIESGAKGGTVNALQISCLLGQIELEGKRPPMMLSGKTLPSFQAYDMTPRAGGFITGRFLTGIRPQEFFFHCMAGREGLIDTAVKTSKSGYLQRCLIKHLEGLMTHYDMTVRDTDGTVIQFLYGEDGQDVVKNQLLSKNGLPILARNSWAAQPSGAELDLMRKDISESHDTMKAQSKEIARWERKFGSNRILYPRQEHLRVKNPKAPSSLCTGVRCPDPINSFYPQHTTFGVVSETMEELIHDYLKKNPQNLLINSEKTSTSLVHHAIPSKMKEPSCSLGQKFVKKHEFFETFLSRHMRCLCDSGEPVGLLAAQSIGEPSTQMTLNTFHFAGRGEMNVTLGIPRMREILMTASPNISTPSMDLYVRTDVGLTNADVEDIRAQLHAVTLADVLEDVFIEESIVDRNGYLARSYCLTFNFLPPRLYRRRFRVTNEQIFYFMEKKGGFFSRLVDEVKRKLAEAANIDVFGMDGSRERTTAKKKQEDADKENFFDETEFDSLYKKKSKENDEEDAGESEDEANEEDGFTENRKEADYEAPEDTEQVVVSDEEDEDEDSNTTPAKGIQSKDSSRAPSPTIKTDEDAQVYDVDDVMKTVCLKTKDMDEDDEEIKGSQGGFFSQSVSETMSQERPKNPVKEKKPEDEAQPDEDDQSLYRRSCSTSKLIRVGKVQGIHDFVTKYDFDEKDGRWSQITLTISIDSSRLDLESIVRAVAPLRYIWKVGKITRTFLAKDSEAIVKGLPITRLIKTEGISFLDLVPFAEKIDMTRVYTNDMHAMWNTFGIEAAAQTIRREIRNVFAVYGIAVDPRHLSLIADYMTASGTIQGMNRISLKTHTSPLQQMSFETTASFLQAAAYHGFKDNMDSPSSRIVAGLPNKAGTGCFTLLAKTIPVEDYMWVEREQFTCSQPLDAPFEITWSPKNSSKRSLQDEQDFKDETTKTPASKRRSLVFPSIKKRKIFEDEHDS